MTAICGNFFKPGLYSSIMLILISAYVVNTSFLIFIELYYKKDYTTRNKLATTAPNRKIPSPKNKLFLT